MQLLEDMTCVAVLIGYLDNCQGEDCISAKYIEKLPKKKPKDNIKSKKTPKKVNTGKKNESQFLYGSDMTNIEK